MSKIVIFNMLSLDGYYAGLDGNIDWHSVDDEFNEFAIPHTKEFSALIFGRVTYELMAGFWPKAEFDPKMSKEDVEIAKIMNSVPKIIFSKTVSTVNPAYGANWKNVTFHKDITTETIQKLKTEISGSIGVFGSGEAVHTLTRLKLVDEYRFIISPITLGKGKSMFVEPVKLKLLNSRIFKNGNVLLYYQPV